MKTSKLREHQLAHTREESQHSALNKATTTTTTTTRTAPGASVVRDFGSRDIYPGHEKALDSISLRAFLLGCILGIAFVAGIILATYGHQLWRAAFFLAILSLFHFLEYYVTAAYNTRFANVAAFLITNNGYAYNIAHTGAMAECLITSLLFPQWQSRVSNRTTTTIGFVMIVIGQLTRSWAMVQAGTNFNHTVQTQKSQCHVLVRHGIYSYLRHPSYFGFFWWGLGTQVVMGNSISFLAYALVLWNFFNTRIRREEEYLVTFFGKEYEDYRRTAQVGIPFIP